MMSPQTLVALVAFVGLGSVALYAVFGGADFGGGVWDALAIGPRRDEQRELIEHAVGPVWETNHVWLIFLVVLLFTCFPPAFAALATGLFVPLTFALAGIILRGAAYAFRASANFDPGLSGFWGHVFGMASIITPFFFGAAVGGLTVGGYAWNSPFALGTGVLAVLLCAQIAAIFLTVETAEGALREDFRRRAIGTTLALAAMGGLLLTLARVTSPQTFAALTRPEARAGVAVAMLLGLLVLALLFAGRLLAARFVVALETFAVLAGWYAEQAPYIIPGTLTYRAAAAPPITLEAFLWFTAAGGVVLVPSLLLLFRVFKSEPQAPATDEAG
jgi:cytochrome bd ubiquinol oxidase subunit II